MRIVAGRAADSIIRCVVAFAVAESIRLEAHILNSAGAARRNLGPGAMTLPAEVRHLLGSECSELWHGRFAGYVRFRRPMASLAAHAFAHAQEVETRRLHDIRGMAIEALTHFGGS